MKKLTQKQYKKELRTFFKNTRKYKYSTRCKKLRNKAINLYNKNFRG